LLFYCALPSEFPCRYHHFKTGKQNIKNQKGDDEPDSLASVKKTIQENDNYVNKQFKSGCSHVIPYKGLRFPACSTQQPGMKQKYKHIDVTEKKPRDVIYFTGEKSQGAPVNQSGYQQGENQNGFQEIEKISLHEAAIFSKIL